MKKRNGKVGNLSLRNELDFVNKKNRSQVHFSKSNFEYLLLNQLRKMNFNLPVKIFQSRFDTESCPWATLTTYQKISKLEWGSSGYLETWGSDGG